MNEKFQDIIAQLSDSEKNLVEINRIDEVTKLIPLLLKRVSPQNVNKLSELLKQSVLPSICPEADEDIETLFNKIKLDNNQLFNREVQEQIEDFILKRFQRDKQVVIQKTSDISKVVSLMGEYLNDAITSSGSGSKNVLNIKEKILSMDFTNTGIEDLNDLQEELVSAASLIEDEMNTVNTKLKTGKTKVHELEDKVQLLEEELTKTKNESMKDHLTGLLTRRAYGEEIKKIESSFKRRKTQYAVVFFDLDFFKNVNDTYGHEAGDIVLSTFAKILDKNTRDHDIVGRYGGEEFVAIVHYNLNRELLQYLKRIKTIVTANDFICKEHQIKVTYSAGVAIRSNHESYDSAIQKADIMLYEAKENGRNQTRIEDGKII